MSGKLVWSDGDVLAVLWRYHAMAQTAAQIAVTFGASRSAVLGLVHRQKLALAQMDPDGLSDADLLDLLDQLRGSGVSAASLAQRFGLSRFAVLGLAHQLVFEAAAAGPCVAQRPENRSGGMARLWWADGLGARAAA